MNNHWYNEGIEILNQGRSKKQMEGNYKIGAISIIGMILTLGYIIIFGQKSKSKLFTTHINNLIRIYRMNIGVIITIVIIAVIWGWIFYEMRIAPEVDDEGNIVDKDAKQGETKPMLMVWQVNLDGGDAIARNTYIGVY